jgi:uncharacterized protein YndB with AHSA1/START domain
VPKPRHVLETYIRATPDDIWRALTDPDQLARYSFGPAAITSVKEAEPPTRLVLAFTLADDPETAAEPPSTVTWEIGPSGQPGVCRVGIVHSDFGGLSKTWARTLHGWPRVLAGLKSLLETGDPLALAPTDVAAAAADVDAVHERELAIECNNETWTYLSKTDRAPADDEAMVRIAYAAAHHWSRAEGREPVNEARAEWLISRVLSSLGRGDGALHHARRCLAITEREGLVDFDLAYAHEAMARALAWMGDLAAARGHLDAARAVHVADDEDRAILQSDLVAGPWYGLA